MSHHGRKRNGTEQSKHQMTPNSVRHVRFVYRTNGTAATRSMSLTKNFGGVFVLDKHHYNIVRICDRSTWNAWMCWLNHEMVQHFTHCRRINMYFCAEVDATPRICARKLCGAFCVGRFAYTRRPKALSLRLVLLSRSPHNIVAPVHASVPFLPFKWECGLFPDQRLRLLTKFHYLGAALCICFYYIIRK